MINIIRKNIERLLLGGALLSTMMSFSSGANCESHCDEVALQDVTYIEPKEEVELNFNTNKYLPADFDAYRGMEPNLDEISYIKPRQKVSLDFDTQKYLPIGFDARKGMPIDLDTIEYIKEKEEVELKFNTNEYLPKNFSVR